MRNSIYILLMLVGMSAAASAQSLSVEDLQKQIDAEMTKGSEYGELLNDPDPKRALAAMKVMMASGDPELVKVAADYGLYSANEAVRAEALKGFLATKPRVDISFMEAGSQGDFLFAMRKLYNSIPNSDGIVAATIVVGEYDAKTDCYGLGRRQCALQIRPGSIRISLNDLWTEVTLTEDAAITGNVDLGNATNVPMRIQLR